MLIKNIKFAAYVLMVLCCSLVKADSYVDFFRALNIDNDGTVATLLLRGFDPNSRDEKGQPALLLSMREGSFKSAALLLASPQLDVDATNAAQETALMMAALKGYTPWCERLIQRGAHVNRKDWSPLHYAASGPQVDAVALLLDRGAAIDARAPNGNTPLMMAALFGTEESARLLLARGADRRLRNKQQRRAADLARGGGRDWMADLIERATR